MGSTYTRQSSTEIVDGEVIQASDFNNEFEQLVSAFAVSTGHSHDGTTAEGGPVTKLLGTAITIGDGTSGTDIAVTFDGESSDGVLTWMEDEDHFKFSDDVVIDSSKRIYLYDEGGEYIYGDGTDLYLVSGADINIPANIGLTFGNDGEKIEGDGTDLTISGNNINLTATADVVIPADVGITFGTGEKIEGDSTDLTITSGAKINLTATSDVVIPANVGITFGTGEKIEGDSTDLTVTSGADINLTATSDVNIPADVGITFGDDGEKIEGDGTDLTISASALFNVDAGTDIVLDAGGGDVFFKDDGTTFGSATNTSGNLIIKSGTTTALTFSGANVTGAGTYTGGGLMTTGGNIVIPDAGNIGSASDTDAIAISSGGVVTFSQNPVFPDGGTDIADLDIDGGTDIGADLTTSDLIIVDDGAGGTNRKAALSRINTLVQTAGGFPLTALDIDGGTDIGEAIVDADLFIVDNGAGGTNRKTAASRLKTYIASSAADPSSADGDSLGTASAEWSDLYLADGGVIYFGNDQDVTVTHDPDDGLILKSIATSDDNPFLLTIQTGETDIAADDILGTINFQAPDEAQGTDAILVAAGIDAVSEGDFSSSNNATKLSFKTAASEAAAEKASLSSTGVFTATSFAGSGAGLTAGTTPLTTLDIDGGTDIGEAIVDADLFIIDNGAGGTNRKTAASRLKTYVGAADLTSIGSNLVPDGVGTRDIGTTSAEWNDIYLADTSVVYFGNDQDITLTHVADVGLTLTHVATADNKPIVFQLKSEEDAIIADEVIASIEFAAGDSDGTDGATVAAGIHAIAEGTFAADANATKLVFTTGVSETAASSATAKMTLSSAGLLTVADDIVFKDGGTIGVSSATDAMTVSSAGIVTFKDDILIKDGGTIGVASAATAMTISSAGIVTFVDDILIKDGGTIGVASTADALTLSSAGLLTVKDDLIIKDGGTIGGSADADLLTLGNGVLTVTGKLSLADAGYVDISTPLLAGADHTYTGTTAQMLAGGAIAAFDLVCIHTTTGEVVEADASAYATARVIGIAPAAISDTATGTVLLHGFIRDDTWNWTTGSTLYASETAGAMTHTAPTTDGAFVQVVGVALEPDVVYINPSMDVIEHA